MQKLKLIASIYCCKWVSNNVFIGYFCSRINAFQASAFKKKKDRCFCYTSLRAYAKFINITDNVKFTNTKSTKLDDNSRTYTASTHALFTL